MNTIGKILKSLLLMSVPDAVLALAIQYAISNYGTQKLITWLTHHIQSLNGMTYFELYMTILIWLFYLAVALWLRRVWWVWLYFWMNMEPLIKTELQYMIDNNLPKLRNYDIINTQDYYEFSFTESYLPEDAKIAAAVKIQSLQEARYRSELSKIWQSDIVVKEALKRYREIPDN